MAVIIMGIDPGLRTTGWGAIRAEGSALAFVGAGTISSCADSALCDRLAALYRGLSDVLAALSPASLLDALVSPAMRLSETIDSGSLATARGSGYQRFFL